MATASGMTINIQLVGARETLAAFSKLPADANRAIRDRSQELADTLAGRIRTAAQADSPQSALMADTVKSVRDRVPAIVAGGKARVGRHGNPAFKILFGSEFGSNRWPQFRPHLGKGSYWLLRTVEANKPLIVEGWRKAADDIARQFTITGRAL